MRMIRISTEVEVEIDLDDYFDEFLEDADDNDLIKELKERGYSVEKQALPIKNEWGVNHEQNNRFLCDLLDIGYHTRNNVLIDLIINNIR